YLAFTSRAEPPNRAERLSTSAHTDRNPNVTQQKNCDKIMRKGTNSLFTNTIATRDGVSPESHPDVFRLMHLAPLKNARRLSRSAFRRNQRPLTQPETCARCAISATQLQALPGSIAGWKSWPHVAGNRTVHWRNPSASDC